MSSAVPEDGRLTGSDGRAAPPSGNFEGGLESGAGSVDGAGGDSFLSSAVPEDGSDGRAAPKSGNFEGGLGLDSDPEGAFFFGGVLRRTR